MLLQSKVKHGVLLWIVVISTANQYHGVTILGNV